MPRVYTFKFERARVAGYQTTILAVQHSRHSVVHPKAWVEKLTTHLNGVIGARMGLSPQHYPLEFRLIEVDRALGGQENPNGDPV